MRVADPQTRETYLRSMTIHFSSTPLLHFANTNYHHISSAHLTHKPKTQTLCSASKAIPANNTSQ